VQFSVKVLKEKYLESESCVGFLVSLLEAGGASGFERLTFVFGYAWIF
jgi:hypothetical protein